MKFRCASDNVYHICAKEFSFTNKNQFLTKLPKISQIHKNHNFKVLLMTVVKEDFKCHFDKNELLMVLKRYRSENILTKFWTI